jgi:dienelactone hydrolase
MPAFTPQPVAAGDVFDDLAFQSGDITLVGQLQLPEGEGPFPALIWVHGSGRSTRHEADGLAETLVHNGYAVFRYDKRGIGDSGGVYSGVSAGNSQRLLSELAADAAAAADFLADRPEVDAAHIGLFGASQAGWIVPQAAALSEHVSFVALISGPAVSVGDENLYSAMTANQNGSISEAEAEEYSARLAAYEYDFGYDPRQAIAALRIPALWILGGRDASQPTRETVAILEELRLSNPNITIFVYPRANHSLIGFPFMDEVLLPWLSAAAH